MPIRSRGLRGGRTVVPVAVVALILAGCAGAAVVRAEPAASPTPVWSRVVVTLRPAAADPESIRSARDLLLAGLPPDGHRVVRTYTAVPALALEVSPAALEVLRSSPLVAHVKPDSPERISPDR